MDLEDNEFLKFVKAAGENHLEYLLIGGLALAMHGVDSSFTLDKLSKSISRADFGKSVNFATEQLIKRKKATTCKYFILILKV